MVHRILFRAHLIDSLMLLALSCAAYHHTGQAWLLYMIYISSAMTFIGVMSDVSSWPKYVGDAITVQAKAINFHAQCIRDKEIQIDHTGTINNKHSGTIANQLSGEVENHRR